MTSKRLKPYIYRMFTQCLRCIKNDLVTDHMSFNTFSDLLAMDNETKLLDFLTELGVIAKHYQCEFCGYQMRKVKQRGVWYWLCTRRVAGLKCNRGKFGVRKGTFFDHSHFTIQTLLRIVYNFVCRLNEGLFFTSKPYLCLF